MIVFQFPISLSAYQDNQSAYLGAPSAYLGAPTAYLRNSENEAKLSPTLISSGLAEIGNISRLFGFI